MHFWEFRTDDILKEWGQDYVVNALVTWKPDLKDSKSVDCSVLACIAMQQQNTFWQKTAVFASISRLKFVKQHLTVTCTVHCWSPPQILSLFSPQNCWHHFTGRGLSAEFFLPGELGCFNSTLWHLASGSKWRSTFYLQWWFFPKSITFIATVIQETLTDI